MPTQIGRNLGQVHQGFFALNLGFGIVSAFVYGPVATQSAIAPFFHLERRLNQILHIRQGDYLRGYFGSAIPTIILAVAIFLLIRIFSGPRLTGHLLRFAAGLAALFLYPAFWFVGYGKGDPFVGGPIRGGTLEVACVLVAFLAASFSKKPWPGWIAVFVVAGHFFFWDFIMDGGFNPEWGVPGYIGPYGLIVGFLSAAAWLAYMRFASTREAPATIAM
jgi:hypothetical protein